MIAAAAHTIVNLKESSPDVSITAIVAASAAILGAVVGGYASYRANLALEVRRRRMRVAIRRKAKVYTPLRGELIKLSRELQKDAHLQYGIKTEQRDPQYPDRGPSWRLWRSLNEDGRAATSASRLVAERLDAVEGAIDRLEARRDEAFSTLAEVGDLTYTEVVGESPTVVNAWDNGTALLEVLRDETDEVWYPWQRTPGVPHFVELRAKFNASDEVRAVRMRLSESDGNLREQVDNAAAALDAGIAMIARKYELEEVED